MPQRGGFQPAVWSTALLIVKVPAVGQRMKLPPIGRWMFHGVPLVCVKTRPSCTVLVHVPTTVPVEHVSVPVPTRACIVQALDANTVVALVQDGLMAITAALAVFVAW